MSAPTTSAERERPILFSGEMVRAILAGRKVQTRRPIVPQPEPRAPRRMLVPEDGARTGQPGVWLFDERWEDEYGRHGVLIEPRRCPYGAVGDRLWVRETHALVAEPILASAPGIAYRADGAVRWLESLPDGLTVYNVVKPEIWKWRPSIFMRREWSRIELEITGVRVERLDEISVDDVQAEGIERVEDEAHAGQYWREETVARFAELWDGINAARGYPFHAAPWVWVIEFRRIGGEG